jgi:hypothetical protein
MKNRLVYDANGNPFHLPGTQIYVEPDGHLTFECPHCDPRPVPRHLLSDLAKYARKRTATRKARPRLVRALRDPRNT